MSSTCHLPACVIVTCAHTSPFYNKFTVQLACSALVYHWRKPILAGCFLSVGPQPARLLISTEFPRFSTGFPNFSTGFPNFSTGFPNLSTGFPNFGFPNFSTEFPAYQLHFPIFQLDFPISQLDFQFINYISQFFNWISQFVNWISNLSTTFHNFPIFQQDFLNSPNWMLCHIPVPLFCVTFLFTNHNNFLLRVR